MKMGRNLLFHRDFVDDSVGCYVTDYVVGGIFVVLAGYLLYMIRRHKSRDDARAMLSKRLEAHWEWFPWNWPRPIVTSITMTTYATLIEFITFSLLTILGGLPHQFLQTVEPYESPSDGWIWLILWRIAAGFAFVIIAAMFTILEQINNQESILIMPRLARIAFYGIMAIIVFCCMTFNFVRLTDDLNPYDIRYLYLSFVACTFVHSIGMTLVVAVTEYRHCCRRRTRHEDIENTEGTDDEKSSLEDNGIPEEPCDVRWDLYLHFACPWLLVAGSIFSYVLTPTCSVNDAAMEHGCPLPDAFNHNSVMHVIHLVAIVILFWGEYKAIQRRARLCCEINVKESPRTEII